MTSSSTTRRSKNAGEAAFTRARRADASASCYVAVSRFNEAPQASFRGPRTQVATAPPHPHR